MANMMDYIQWRGDLTFSEKTLQRGGRTDIRGAVLCGLFQQVPNTVVEGITSKRAGGGGVLS